MPRRSARIAAKRKRNSQIIANDDDEKELSPPPKKKRKRNDDADPMDDADSPFPTQWNTSDDEEDAPQPVGPEIDDKEENDKPAKGRTVKSRKNSQSTKRRRKRRRSRRKRKQSDDEIYDPDQEEMPRTPRRPRTRRGAKKKISARCEERDVVRMESMDIDGVRDHQQTKDAVEERTETDGDSDSEDVDEGLDGIFDGLNTSTPKPPSKEDRGSSPKTELCQSDESVPLKPRKSAKKKRRKKPKGEYSREQIEMVFETLDAEGTGTLSMRDILSGFHAINQSDKIEAGLAKRMLLCADKQHDNDSVVRLEDFLAMTRLADLWPVA